MYKFILIIGDNYELLHKFVRAEKYRFFFEWWKQYNEMKASKSIEGITLPISDIFLSLIQ